MNKELLKHYSLVAVIKFSRGNNPVFNEPFEL